MGRMMRQKYSHYEYEIHETDVAIASTSEHEEYKTGYVFTIFDVYAGSDHESDEWYETESEAVIAAEHMIDTLEDGPDDCDYDTPNYFEQGPEYWAERRALGE